jgi:hypothetical protein
MSEIDKKIYTSLMFHIKNKKRISIQSIARHARIERYSIYYRLNKLAS